MAQALSLTMGLYEHTATYSGTTSGFITEAQTGRIKLMYIHGYS